jgi:hypothetical protein
MRTIASVLVSLSLLALCACDDGHEEQWQNRIVVCEDEADECGLGCEEAAEGGEAICYDQYPWSVEDFYACYEGYVEEQILCLYSCMDDLSTCFRDSY